MPHPSPTSVSNTSSTSSRGGRHSDGVPYKKFLWAVITAALTSCSIAAAPQSASLHLPAPQSGDSWQIQQIGSSPNTYKISSPERAQPVFMTVIQDCTIGSSKLSGSAKALARQLFVGIKGVQIYKQNPVENLSGTAIRWLLSGSLEDRPVIIASFLNRNGRCLKDVVLWQFPETDTDLSLSSQTKSFPERIAPLEGLIARELSFGETG